MNLSVLLLIALAIVLAAVAHLVPGNAKIYCSVVSIIAAAGALVIGGAGV